MKKLLVIICFILLSSRANSQNNVTMNLQIQASASNEILFNVSITNDGSNALSLSGVSFGVDFDPILLDGALLGVNAFNYQPATADIVMNQFNYNTQYLNHQLQFSAIPIASGQPFAIGAIINLGQFKFTSTQPLTSQNDLLLTFSMLGGVGKTKCEVMGLPNGSSNSVSLTGMAGTLSTNISGGNSCNSQNSTLANACDSYTWSMNASTYIFPGTYVSYMLNQNNCAHAEVLNLNLNYSTFNTTNALLTAGTYTWAVNQVIYNTAGTYTFTMLNASGCTHVETLHLTSSTTTTDLHLKLNIQGYSNGSVMVPARLTCATNNSNNIAQMVTVELVQQGSMGLSVVASASAPVSITGICTPQFQGTFTGSYYIRVKGCSFLETTSSVVINPASTSSTSPYDFTISSTQAFDNDLNDALPAMATGNSFHSGDVNEDGNINLSDAVEIANGIASNLGCSCSDLNGDGSLTQVDLSIMQSNLFQWSKRPY